MRYLTPEWLDAASEAAGDTGGADGDRLVVEHVVESGPDGDVVYHVVLGTGGATIRAGGVAQPDVTFRQSYATAAAVAQGTRSAKEAFLAGEVRVGGNVTRLIGRDHAFTALERALATLRGTTEY